MTDTQYCRLEHNLTDITTSPFMFMRCNGFGTIDGIKFGESNSDGYYGCIFCYNTKNNQNGDILTTYKRNNTGNIENIMGTLNIVSSSLNVNVNDHNNELDDDFKKRTNTINKDILYYNYSKQFIINWNTVIYMHMYNIFKSPDIHLFDDIEQFIINVYNLNTLIKQKNNLAINDVFIIGNMKLSTINSSKYYNTYNDNVLKQNNLNIIYDDSIEYTIIPYQYNPYNTNEQLFKTTSLLKYIDLLLYSLGNNNNNKLDWINLYFPHGENGKLDILSNLIIYKTYNDDNKIVKLNNIDIHINNNSIYMIIKFIELFGIIVNA